MASFKQAVGKGLLICLIAGAVFMVLGRNHFLLGSGLGLLRWWVLGIGLLIYWRNKRLKGTRLRQWLLVAIALLLLEWGYTAIRSVKWGGGKVQTQIQAQSQTVSLMTYNLFFKNTYPQNIIQEIKANPADVLVLQELTPAWQSKLAATIFPLYPYRKTYPHKGTHGLAVLSKHPIQSCEYLKNSRGLPVTQICELRVKGQSLILIHTHLPSPAIAVENPDRFFSHLATNYEARKKHLQRIQEYLEKLEKGQSMVMIGDLNTMRIEPLYRDLKYEWHDLYSKKGDWPGWNFPNVHNVPFPLITLDYILYRGNITPLEAKVLPGSSSDHLAIWGRLQVH